MTDILSYPSRAFDYIQMQYGTIGLMFAALILIVGVISIFIWLDRRR